MYQSEYYEMTNSFEEQFDEVHKKFAGKVDNLDQNGFDDLIQELEDLLGFAKDLQFEERNTVSEYTYEDYMLEQADAYCRENGWD